MMIQQMKLFLLLLLLYINRLKTQEMEELFTLTVDGLLMNQALITASSTCGMNGPERFCRLVDEGRDGFSNMMTNGQNNILCDICDNNNQSRRHPIDYAKSDDDNQWWQSPSMAQGVQYEQVNVTIDLQQVYQIVYIILKMGDSPRPGNWILERSLDGVLYDPWIFFAESSFDCYSLYRKRYPGLKLTINERPLNLNDDEVFCTTYYSQTKNLRSGEIIISLINGRSSLMKFQNSYEQQKISQILINFLSARYIRLRFLKHLTLSADLMTHRGFLEKSIYNRYFYSLRNVEIGGKCICNNHADRCEKTIVNGINVAKCNCKHNTCGRNCELCCPLFNQKPWKQGMTCEECNCNRKSNECVYNQTTANLQLSMNKIGNMDGGGVCLNCRENTAGINCEKCRPGYYRPYNVQAIESNPCRFCECHGPGSIGECISNGEEVGNQFPGDCKCKPGYTGKQCNKCSLGYQLDPISRLCVPCPCNIIGSVQSQLYHCQPVCNCKINVDPSTNCSRCKFGFFNLQRDNAEGCQACFCFGITNKCSSLNLRTVTIQQLDQWYLVSLTHLKAPRAAPQMTALRYPIANNKLIDPELNRPSVYYWSAPKTYLGNWLTSYRSELMFVVRIDVEITNIGSQIDSPDIILVCGSDRLIHSLDSSDQRLQRKTLIPLRESYWLLQSTNSRPTKDQMMSCLVDIQHLLIKAKYYTAQKSVSLLNVTLNRGNSELTARNQMPYIEKCQCPPGYAGISCEACQPGFRRLSNVLVQGRCVPCACNNHSFTCDAYTGDCKNCSKHTDGPLCNLCKPGYYGNAENSQAKEPCRRCKCPRLDYQMTDKCKNFNSAGFVCEDCQQNTAGPYCQRCIDGYYGDPVNKIPCRKCQCNNNEDSCDSKSGICSCSFRTTGVNCELCSSGFYGNAINKSCIACGCSTSGGSKSPYCDRTTGQCQCNRDFTGRRCDLCKPGLYQVTNSSDSECQPCVCIREGVKYIGGRSCDSKTGRCFCKDRITHKSCSKCLPDHFGFPECQKCGCSMHALTQQCDSTTGICKCGRNVADIKCNRCQLNHFWATRVECQKCSCGNGTETPDVCDADNGQCTCSPHVTGKRCDRCAEGYWGLSKQGCKKCALCPHGKVCDPQYGFCKCPRNTEGPYCETCVANSFGYNQINGCQMCNCSLIGSNSKSCDRISGKCNCRADYDGRKCDKCLPKNYKYPECLDCACNKAGSLPGYNGRCDPTTGQCYCKPNAQGRKCDQCKPNTFSLSKSYEGGCFKCFCSGRNSSCSVMNDLKLIRHFTKQFVIYNQFQGHVTNRDYTLLKLSNTSQLDYGWPLKIYRGIYVDLIKLLPGHDLTRFYRQKLLQFTLQMPELTSYKGNKFGNVIMESFGGDVQLNYQTTGIQQSSVNQSWSIPIGLQEISESGEWFLSKFSSMGINNQQIVLTGPQSIFPLDMRRGILMMALLNVTSFKVELFPKDIQNNPEKIALTVEVNAIVETKYSIGQQVNTVEKCECDNFTKGIHCEEAVAGYYREIKTREGSRPFVNFTVIVNINPLINVSICQCYQHSQYCDPNTGQCVNCTGYTTGHNCHLCKPGYYGDPKRDDCKACPCPSTTNNYATSCQFNSRIGGFQCKCRSNEGYTGNNCEKCLPGYYGEPVLGKPCQLCQCNPQGSISLNCSSTGQCQCSPNVRGLRCNECASNFVVDNHLCKDCMTGCTKELLERSHQLQNRTRIIQEQAIKSGLEQYLEGVNSSINSYNDKFNQFKLFLNLTKQLKIKHQSFVEFDKKSNNVLEEFQKMEKNYQELRQNLNNSKIEIKQLLESKKIVASDLTRLIDNATGLMNQIDNINKAFNLRLNFVNLYINNFNKVKMKFQNLNNQTKETINPKQYQKFENLLESLKNALEISQNLEIIVKKLSAENEKFKNNQTKFQDRLKNLEGVLEKCKDLQTKILSKYNDNKNKLDALKIRVNTADQLLDERKRNFTDYLTNQTNTRMVIPQNIKEIFDNKSKEADNLIADLGKEERFLENAQRAKEAYSNITRDIKEVESEIKQTKDAIQSTEDQINLDKQRAMINQHIDTNNQLESILIKSTQNFNSSQAKYWNYKDAILLQQTMLNAIINGSTALPSIDGLKQKFNDVTEKQNKINNGVIKDINNILKEISQPNQTSSTTKDLAKEIAAATQIINDKLFKPSEDLTKSISELSQRIKALRQRIRSKTVPSSELSHGSAAKSQEPARIGSACVRHYQNYYLPPTYDFSLEFYLLREFNDVKTLVLFGYDDSIGINAFAVTLEEDNSMKFIWESHKLVRTMILPNITQIPFKYGFYSIQNIQDKWKMLTTDPDKSTEILANSISNRLLVSPTSHLFIGGYPDSELTKNLNLHGELNALLLRDYKKLNYRGCIFGVKLNRFLVGLADFTEIAAKCQTSLDYVLKDKNFNCKVPLKHVKTVNQMSNNLLYKRLLRQKRRAESLSKYLSLYEGQGYLFMNFSDDELPRRNNFNCPNVFKGAFMLSARLFNANTNNNQGQIVAIFANEVKNYGFVVTMDKLNSYQLGEWRDGKIQKFDKIEPENFQEIGTGLVWNIMNQQLKSRPNETPFFGIDEVCDPDSFMTLGGFSRASDRIKAMLEKLSVNTKLSFSGGIGFSAFGNDKRPELKMPTRFVQKSSIAMNDALLSSIPAYSLFIASPFNSKITVNPDILPNIIRDNSYIDFDIDLNDQYPTKLSTLFSIDFTSAKIELEISPHKTLILKTSNNQHNSLTTKLTTTRFNVRLNIQPKLVICLINNNAMGTDSAAFNKVTSAQFHPLGIDYFIYNVIVGQTKLNFNNVQLPTAVYIQLPPVSLQPLGELASTSFNPKPPNNKAGIITSANYPEDSVWFNGTKSTFTSINEKILSKYNTGNKFEISLRTRSTSQRSELLMSLDINRVGEESETLRLLSLEGQLALQMNNWCVQLPYWLNNENWQFVSISNRLSSDGASLYNGIRLMVNGQPFDFPNSPIKALRLTQISAIKAGGFSESSLSIECNARQHPIEFFTGCMDDLRVNNRSLRIIDWSLVKLTPSNQCPRVLDFVKNGGQILDSYAKISQPADFMKLQFKKLPKLMPNSEIYCKIAVTLKYTEFERGVLLSIGDQKRFILVAFQDKQIVLHSIQASIKEQRQISLAKTKPGLITVKFELIHSPNIYTIFRLEYETEVVIALLSERNTIFDDASLISPDIFIGNNPYMSQPISTNFVGCISEIICEFNKQRVDCGLDSSRHMKKGHCSLDKQTYLRRFRLI